MSVLPGASPFSYNDNITSTWFGVVALQGGFQVAAVLKDIPPKEMANELLAAALASSLGLPVPRTFLALASTENLDARYGHRISDSHRVIFASERKGAPPFADFWIGGRQPPRRYLERLASWNKFGATFGFDVWTANTDRHAGNILYGGEGEPWLIDHGRCFTGERWFADDLHPEKNYPNRLVDWLLPHVDADGRKRLSTAVDDLVRGIEELDLEEILRISRASSLLTSTDANAILTFLNGRKAHTAPLSRQQAGYLL